MPNGVRRAFDLESPVGTQKVSLLTCDVGGRRIAVLATVVQAVTRAVAVSPLPKAPPIVEGVVNVRGTLVPVLDIRQRFGISPRALTPDQHMVIARSGPRVVALRVDRAVNLTSVSEADIASAPQVVPGVEYVAGIALLPDGLIVIHDLDRCLSLDEAAQVDASLSEAATVAQASPARTVKTGARNG
ncbi:MAG: chemotaxis protein CheW [Gemmatimonadaceae bacterium]